MTNFPAGGVFGGQTEFAGVAADRLYHPDWTAKAKLAPDQPTHEPSYQQVHALVYPIAGHHGLNVPAAPSGTAPHPAGYDRLFNASEEWFERMHILPRSFALGNIVTAIEEEIELYNADRYLPHLLTAFTNNTPGGVTITDMPSLPALIGHQQHLLLTMRVGVDGTFQVNGETLVFTFDLGDIAVPISFSTILLWGLLPEAGYRERLEFLTDVMIKTLATEQRVGLRKNPRQFFEFVHMLSEGTERSFYENMIFEHEGRTLALPIWHEQTNLSVAVAINDTVINVDTTADADFRVGGLAIIYTDQFHFEVQTIASKTGTSITLENPSLNAYPVGTLVMPLRTAVFSAKVQGARFPVNLSALQITFRVKDNDVGDLASAAGFSSLLGKVLIDDYLGIQGTSSEDFDKNVFVHDPGVGASYEVAQWNRGRRGRPLELIASGKAGLWRVRQLLHFLDGRRVSFYLPTWLKDLVPILPLGAGTALLHVANVGYTANVQARQPKTLIRIIFNDGSPTLTRTVIGSVVVDEDQETLTLSTTWPSTFAADTVDRIDYVEPARLDSDTVTIEHAPGFQFKRITVPVRNLIA